MRTTKSLLFFFYTNLLFLFFFLVGGGVVMVPLNTFSLTLVSSPSQSAPSRQTYLPKGMTVTMTPT